MLKRIFTLCLKKGNGAEEREREGWRTYLSSITKRSNLKERRKVGSIVRRKC